MQLVSLAPEDLGEWEKPKAPKKKKETKEKKATGEEEKEEEEEDEEEENEDDAANEGGTDDDDQAKEVYIPRPTAHPRGNASTDEAAPTRKRKVAGTPSRNATAAAERRAKKLKGTGTGAQPTLMQMGFTAKPSRYALLISVFLLSNPFELI